MGAVCNPDISVPGPNLTESATAGCGANNDHATATHGQLHDHTNLHPGRIIDASQYAWWNARDCFH